MVAKAHRVDAPGLILEQHQRSDDADRRLIAECGVEYGQAIRRDAGVAVDQQHGIRAASERLSDAQVDTAGKAEVPACRQPDYVLPDLAEKAPVIVIGVVVDDDDPP